MIKIFISSVQDEFAEERMLLKAYIEKSPLLRRFFSVFVFEADVPPTDRRTDEVYLEELRNSDLYLLLIGNRYSSWTEDGISPTEREYDEATSRGIQRLAFVRDEPTGREPRERQFLSKVSKDVTWHSFADRLEIYNPGSINPALTPEKLKERHGSFPNNPLIAEPLYLTKYIERLGSGLTDLIEHCRAVGLPDPEFHIDRFEFGIVIRRKGAGGVNGAEERRVLCQIESINPCRSSIQTSAATGTRSSRTRTSIGAARPYT